MKKNKFLVVMLSIALISVISSCKKDKTNNSTDTELAISIQQNDAEATKVYDLITDEVNDLSASIDSADYNFSKTIDTCTSIVVNHPGATTWPKIITINFTGECTTDNGNVLKGQIIINQTDRYRNTGMVRTISFNGFSINGNLVSGTKTITNVGLVNGFKTYSVSIVNGSITTPAGEVLATREAERTRTWIEGESTPQKDDDVFLITGNTSGSTRNGKVFNANITIPLRVARSCRWIEQGQITTTILDGPVVIIDFGNGTCDRIATITVNDNTRTITLRN